MSYGKIFESLFTGSMVGSGTDVFAVWAYCIANAKPPGTIELNPRILAAILGCEQDRVDAAIHVLTSPDEYSRTEIEQGRRLVQEGKFLYRMPTWETYNKIKNEFERREQNRRHQQAYRDRRKGVSADVSDVRLASAQSAHEDIDTDVDTDVDADVDQSQSTPPAPQGGSGVSADGSVKKKRRKRKSVYAPGTPEREAFEEFFYRWPKTRRQAVDDAEKAFSKLDADWTDENQTHAFLMHAIAFIEQLQAKKNYDEQFVPYPASWIRANASAIEEVIQEAAKEQEIKHEAITE